MYKNYLLTNKKLKIIIKLNNMKKLSKKQIIAICDNVLKTLKQAQKSKERVYVDLLFKMEISAIEYAELYSINISELIPEFTIQNAIIMANAEPDDVDGSLWWDGTVNHFDYENRIKFIEFIKDCYTVKN